MRRLCPVLGLHAPRVSQSSEGPGTWRERVLCQGLWAGGASEVRICPDAQTLPFPTSHLRRVVPTPFRHPRKCFKVFPNLPGALGDSGLGGPASCLHAAAWSSLFRPQSEKTSTGTQRQRLAGARPRQPLVARILVLSVGGSDGT